MVARDLTRNLGFSFATIVVITLILIADLRVSLVVLASVVMTVANVTGFSHFCGLTIEITSSVVLILCVGLGLDYSAHIGVAYLTSKAPTREGDFYCTRCPICSWTWVGFTLIRVFSSLAPLPSRFCQIPISPGRIGQTV